MNPNNNPTLIHIDDVTYYDIQMGRGGHTTSHDEFHQQYPGLYLTATSNREKRIVQQMLVDFVHYHGGRFLRRVNATWYIEIGLDEALKKASNALREDRIRHRVSVLDTFEIFQGME